MTGKIMHKVGEDIFPGCIINKGSVSRNIRNLYKSIRKTDKRHTETFHRSGKENSQ